MQDLARTVGQMTLPSTSEILAKSQASPFWGTKRRERFAIPHIRRQSPPTNTILYDGMEMTSTQRSVSKGYSDGFLTAKIFATYKTSKLGFIGQYIEDSIKALGPAIIEPGTEEAYRHWFRSGLGDGQLIVVSAVSL
jgi:glucan 1,3-beta-glucosidase